MKVIEILLQEIIQGRVLLLNLAKNDLKSRYAGSFFGIVWALIQPLVTILVFWYVFQVGFKTAPVNNVEFILWFAAAYIPWVYFNDGLMSTTNCLYEYNYLIKKIKFPVSLLPLVKVCSSAMIHSFFICFIPCHYPKIGSQCRMLHKAYRIDKCISIALRDVIQRIQFDCKQHCFRHSFRRPEYWRQPKSYL